MIQCWIALLLALDLCGSMYLEVSALTVGHFINPRCMREGYGSRFVCLCVSVCVCVCLLPS